MKKDPVTLILTVVVVIAVIATAALATQYVRSVGELQRLQYRANLQGYERSQAQALANDAVAYSRTNRAIEPVLQSLGVRTRQTNDATLQKP